MSNRIDRYRPNYTPCGQARREFLWEVGGGFAGLALIDLLSKDGFFEKQALASGSTKSANEPQNSLAPKAPHFPVKAKHVVFFFMNGGPSHVDTFDYKPALSRFNGSPYQGDLQQVGSNGRPVGNLMQTPFEFRKHGQSGLEISSLYPFLHLMGFDHTKLIYFYHGLNERLTGQRGNVVKKVLT